VGRLEFASRQLNPRKFGDGGQLLPTRLELTTLSRSYETDLLAAHQYRLESLTSSGGTTGWLVSSPPS
jgi:tRNA A37 threonylcarbamoyladenosine dehydratase